MCQDGCDNMIIEGEATASTQVLLLEPLQYVFYCRITAASSLHATKHIFIHFSELFACLLLERTTLKEINHFVTEYRFLGVT